MKTLISAIALLVVSNIAAMAADQTLKFKLVSFYMGDKDGESHFSGVTVSPNGTNWHQGLLRQTGRKWHVNRT
jgi:hypothetical protein